MEKVSSTRTPDATAPFVAAGPRLSVADFMGARPIKVPSWFTAAAALRVCRLKRAQHLIVLDRQQLVGTVAAADLAAAPAHEPVGRAMAAARLTVNADSSPLAALILMNVHGLDCLPVVSGALLVGVVTRAALVSRQV